MDGPKQAHTDVLVACFGKPWQPHQSRQRAG